MSLLGLLDVNEDQIEVTASGEVSFTKIENKRYGNYYVMDDNKEIALTEGQLSLLKKTNTVHIKRYCEDLNTYSVEVHCENPEYNKISAFEYCTYTVFVSENINDLIKAVRYFNSVCKIKVQGLHF